MKLQWKQERRETGGNVTQHLKWQNNQTSLTHYKRVNPSQKKKKSSEQ